MKRLLTILLFLALPLTAGAQVSGSLFKLSSNSIFPVNSSWTMTLPYLGGGGTQTVCATNAGLLSVTGCAGGGSSTFGTTSISALLPLIWNTSTAQLSTLFGTSTTWGIGSNGFVVTGATGIPFIAASSTLNLPNSALANSSITVNGTLFNLGDSHTITAASSTLLTDANTFSGVNNFTNASSNFAGTWQNLSPSNFDTFGNAFTFVQGTPNYLTGTTSPLGIILTASSTIGNGAQNGGLTINGGATTTGNLTVTGAISLGGAPVVANRINLATGGGVSINSSTIIDNTHLGSTVINSSLQTVGTLSSLLVSGNVGIGTTSPFAQLSVAGSAGGTNSIFAISTSTSGFATSTALMVDKNGNLSLLNGAGLTLSSLATPAGSFLAVNTSGQVIATTTPSGGTTYTGTYPIIVSGTTISSGFATTTTWGMGNNAFIVTGATGIPYGAASSTLNLPNSALANSSITFTTNYPFGGGGSVALGGTFTPTWLGLSTTTNSGMSAGNLYVGSNGVFQTSASSSIFGFTPIGTTTTTGMTNNGLVMTGSTGILFSQATSSAIALSSLTLGTPLSGAYGGTGIATSFSTNGAVQVSGGNWSVGTLPVSDGGTGAVTLTGCLTGNGTGAITGSGTCNTSNASVSSVGLSSTNSTLSIGSSPVTTSGTITADLNLGHSNIWTVLQTFGSASTTALSAYTAAFGGTGTTSVASTGQLNGIDVATGFTGITSPLTRLTLSSASTTSWVGTTSTAYIPTAVAPFAGTIKSAQCSTDASFLGIDIYIASTHLTYFVASTTVGTIVFSANNTFTNGQLINMSVGTTTTSGASKAECTLNIVQTT